MGHLKRTQNILLAIVAAAIGFSAIAYNAANLVAPDLVVIQPYSDVEARYYAEFPHLTAESALSGEFQDSLDAFLSDHVPNRTDAALLNAGMQRSGISAAAALFGYGVYPTFFESSYYAVPQDGILAGRAEEAPCDNGGETLDAWVNTLNSAAERHPDIRFVYDCVARHDQTEWNPTYRYLNNRLNAAWAKTNIVDRLDPHITAFVDAVGSYDEVKTEWFATDGHWTLRRALKSYNKVAEALSLKTYEYTDPVEVVDRSHGD